MLPQLLIPLSVLSFAIGIAAFVLCLLIYLAGRSPLSKCLVALQALIAYAAFYFFAVVNLRFAVYGSPAVIVAWHCAGQVWSGFFCYFYCLFFYRLTGTELPERGRKLLAGICSVFALSCLAPFFSSEDLGTLVARINFQNSFIVLPIDLSAVVFASILELSALGRMGESPARSVIRIDLVVKAVVIPASVVALILEARLPAFWDLWKFICVHAYFLAWNVAIVLITAGIMRPVGRVPLRRIGNAPGAQAFSGRAAARRGPGFGRAEDGEMEEAREELDRLRRTMESEKAFLDPELTLPSLAERLGMPRNRLSRLLNEAIGKSYADFVNDYRIEEAKALLSSPGRGMDVLGVAFESGFNSKATFYSAFKRVTGMAPNEYRASLASPER